MAANTVEAVIVLKQTGHEVAMAPGRDIWWEDALADQSDECEPESAGCRASVVFLLYTSGSTGKPKGVQHSSAGYLLNAKLTNKWVFDLRDDDIFWCTADVGWITGHSPTLPTGRWQPAPRSSSTRVPRPIPMPGVSGKSAPRLASRFFTRHRRPFVR